MNKILEQAFTEQARVLFGLVEAYYDNEDMINAYRNGEGTINGKYAKYMPQTDIEKCIDDLEQEKGLITERIKTCSIDVDFSQMFDEIMANLDEPMNEQQRERYCFSLITPFEPYSRTLCPDVLLRKSQDSIKSLQGVDGAERMIAMFQQQIEDAQNKAQRYFDMAFTAEALATKDVIECAFRDLAWQIGDYANMLDAAFVLHGLDLKELQNRCGVWIKQFIGGNAENQHRASQIAPYIGSVTLAEEYLNKLEPQQEQPDNEQEQQPEPQQGEQEKTTMPEEEQEIPTIQNTDKERLVFGNALQKQYMILKDGCYKWNLSKSLLAYMCGRLYCGDRIKEDSSDYSQEYIKGTTQMPAKELKALFGVDVASNRYSIKAPPRNSYKVDELFKSNRASR